MAYPENRPPGVFLSHSSSNKPFARMLARRLEEAGVRVWLDEAEIKVGDSLIQKIGDAIHDADYTVAVISTESVGSAWVQKELQLAMTREIRGRRVVVLPVLLDRCELPVFLRDKLYADFTSPSLYEHGVAALLRAVGGQASPSSLGPADVAADPSAALSPALAASPGATDIGIIMHERGADYVGFRRVRHGFRFAYAQMIAGLFLTLLAVLTVPVAPPVGLGLAVPSAMLIGAGVIYLQAMFQRRRAYDYDKRLLLIDEDISHFEWPLGQKWMARYHRGKHDRRYRSAMLHEALSWSLECGAILWGILLLIWLL